MDLTISGSHCSIDCFASRYDTNNYSIIIETWMKKQDFKDLRNSMRPGATGELYKIMGRPRNYDKSWTGANTIKLIPIAGSQLSIMKGKKTIFIKNINSMPVNGASGWLNIKIEGLISGSGDL